LFHQAWAESLQAHNIGLTESLASDSWWEHKLLHLWDQDRSKYNLEPDATEERELKGLALRAAHWWSTRQHRMPEILAIEQVYERALPNGPVLFGRLDAVVRWPSQQHPVRHWQLKTYGGGTPSVEIRIIKRSLHETAYRYITEPEFGTEWGGTDLIMFRKLGLTKREAGKLVPRSHDECIVEENLNIPDKLANARMYQLQHCVSQIIETEKTIEGTLIDEIPHIIEQREHACGGMHRNSECVFMDACNGTVSLSDHWLWETHNPLESYE